MRAHSTSKAITTTKNSLLVIDYFLTRKENRGMTKATPLMMSVAETVSYLVVALGGSPEYWTIWLANDRKPGRARHLPANQGPGRPRYSQAAVDAYIDLQRAKRLQQQGISGRASEVFEAFGIGSAGGSSTGRRFDARISAQLDEDTGIPFVQVVTASPLAVYRLSVEQARVVALELINAVEHLAGVPSEAAA